MRSARLRKADGSFHVERRMLRLFLVPEGILYSGFLILDIGSVPAAALSASMKFAGICLCFLFSCLPLVLHPSAFSSEKEKKDSKIVCAAMVFTVLADICLLLTDHYAAGLCFFIAVQLLYLFRFWNSAVMRKEIKAGLLHRLALFAIVAAALFLSFAPMDFLLLLSVFYFINILHNVLLSVRWWKKEKAGSRKQLLFMTGMLLFLFCDINVGLFNLSAYLSVSNAFLQALVRFSAAGMWLFYLPAQVLIALSSAASE